jgi:hypothetical protein
MDRYADLLKQGFMRPKKTKKPTPTQSIVACDDCQNWHRKGRHTADVATRKANRAARKSKTA